MNSFLLGRLGAIVAAVMALGSGSAVAHPHVWVTMTSQIVYGPDGKVTGVRHAWTFDDMFSAFATQGLDSKVKGQFTRKELAPLADVNVSSLKEFDFFTFARAAGKKVEFEDPKKGEYWLDYRDTTLTLNFTLPLKKPVKTDEFKVEVYDPTYFVDFAFAPKNPVALAGAPTDCKVNIKKPQDLSTAEVQKLDEEFFNQLDASNFGERFANKIAVTCS